MSLNRGRNDYDDDDDDMGLGLNSHKFDESKEDLDIDGGGDESPTSAAAKRQLPRLSLNRGFNSNNNNTAHLNPFTSSDESHRAGQEITMGTTPEHDLQLNDHSDDDQEFTLHPYNHHQQPGPSSAAPTQSQFSLGDIQDVEGMGMGEERDKRMSGVIPEHWGQGSSSSLAAASAGQGQAK